MKKVVERGSGALLIWSLILAVLWVVAWAIFQPDWETVMLGAWMAGSVLFWAAVTLWRERRAGRPADEEPLVVIDASHATALLGLAVTGMFLSIVFGPWLAYVSGGAILVALGGLVRERRASRRTLDQVREGRRGA